MILVTKINTVFFFKTAEIKANTSFTVIWEIASFMALVCSSLRPNSTCNTAGDHSRLVSSLARELHCPGAQSISCTTHLKCVFGSFVEQSNSTLSIISLMPKFRVSRLGLRALEGALNFSGIWDLNDLVHCYLELTSPASASALSPQVPKRCSVVTK